DLASSDICSLPNPFPSCASNNPVTVDAGTVRTLAAGTYGDLTINGGTLMLAGGEYVFCNVNVNNASVVTVSAASTLLVTDRFNVQPNAFVNPEGPPADLRILENGLGVNISGSSSSSVVFRGGSEPAAAGAPLAASQCSFGGLRALGARTKVVA